MKTITDYKNFESLDIRVGKIVKVEDSQSKKPTYKITTDFGSEIGTKISCGAYKNYSKETLIGKQIIGVINFMPKKMGPEISEFLVLGVQNEKGETIYLTTETRVPLGAHIF